MSAYIIRRLLLVVPTLLIVSLTIFFIVRLIPSDVIDQMIFERGGTISWQTQLAEREMLEHKLGLDVPIPVQFGRWIKGIVTEGSLGDSLWKDTPVTEEIFSRIPISAELGVIGILVALLISFPIGIYSAIRQDSVGDYVGRSVAIAFIAIPSFWIATMVVVYPSVWWDWMPPIFFTTFAEDPVAHIGQFLIPGVILGLSICGLNMRYVRTMMLEVLRQDYIRTAWAKGLSEKVIVVRHTMKNALIPVITLLGLQLPVIVGGTVILEQIFVLPGMGRLFLDAAIRRDYNIISGVALVSGVVIVFANLGVDLLYGYFDPRIRYE